MPTLSLKIDDRKVQQLLKNTKNAVEKTERFMSIVEKYNKTQIERQFATEGSNITGKWKPLKASTIAQRQRLGFGSGPILNRTGKLKGSFVTKKKTATELVMTSNLHYYKYHQLGTSKMAQRQILGFSSTMERVIYKLFTEYFAKEIRI